MDSSRDRDRVVESELTMDTTTANTVIEPGVVDRDAAVSHEDVLFKPGHRSCAGCGPAVVMRHVLEVTGRNTIVSMATGCMEVVSTPFPESAWGVSWIHNVFANAPAVASGVETAYRAFDRKGYEAYQAHDTVNFVVIAGDGATFDIGLRSLSGMMERGHDILYIAYDNEAYMNTGIQRSSATSLGASTSTSPPGKESYGNDTPKKDMPMIAVAHGCPYVATACLGFSMDFKNKIERALEHEGPKYIQVLAPCMLGWGFEPEKTIEIARLAVETGIQPLYEVVDGRLGEVMRISDRKPVEQYLETQGRFDHLFEDDEGRAVIEELQAWVDAQARELGLDAG